MQLSAAKTKLLAEAVGVVVASAIEVNAAIAVGDDNQAVATARIIDLIAIADIPVDALALTEEQGERFLHAACAMIVAILDSDESDLAAQSFGPSLSMAQHEEIMQAAGISASREFSLAPLVGGWRSGITLPGGRAFVMTADGKYAARLELVLTRLQGGESCACTK